MSASSEPPSDSAAPRPQPKAIVSPVIDTFCVGLGSILFFAPFVLWDFDLIVSQDPDDLLRLTLILNLPHFLASYRIVYRSKESILRYKSASIYVPAGLAAYGLFALLMSGQTPMYWAAMFTVAQGYLAWHYTGQVWGMMATFAYLSGNPFTDWERRLMRGGLRILLVWHLAWFLHYGQDFAGFADLRASFYGWMSALSVVSFLMTLSGFIMYGLRTEKFPSIRALVAWIAVCFWYAAMAKDPNAILWVQMAHAIQYLIFPFRVEVNQQAEGAKPGRRRGWRTVILFATALLVISWVFQKFAEDWAGLVLEPAVGPHAPEAFAWLTLSFLNIHHFYTDGCVWKIGSPVVRKELFAHLRDSNSAGETKPDSASSPGNESPD